MFGRILLSRSSGRSSQAQSVRRSAARPVLCRCNLAAACKEQEWECQYPSISKFEQEDEDNQKMSIRDVLGDVSERAGFA